MVHLKMIRGIYLYLSIDSNSMKIIRTPYDKRERKDIYKYFERTEHSHTHTHTNQKSMLIFIQQKLNK